MRSARALTRASSAERARYIRRLCVWTGRTARFSSTRAVIEVSPCPSRRSSFASVPLMCSRPHMNSRRNGAASHKGDIKRPALHRAAANKATGACHYLLAELRNPRSQAGNYGVCGCLIEMSQYRAERLLASDRSNEHAVEHRQHKQALKGLSEPLAAEHRENAKDDQAQKKA